MSKGFVMLAENQEHDYVLQACVCAMSIHATNSDPKITLITNDKVPKKYHSLFDNIVDIPWTEQNQNTNDVFATKNRWKVYHASPYEETVVLDTDMLVLQDLSAWWKFLENYKTYYVSRVQTYRGKTVTSNYYRKAFTENNLPNLYSAFHYFKKCEFSHRFHEWLELITNNWELFYGTHVTEHYPKHCSMDVSAAIAAKVLNCETMITNSIAKHPTFTHMKPYIQEWQNVTERWQDRVGVYLTDDLRLIIGNHLQQGIFHYVEKDFITTDIVNRYETFLGIA